MRLRTAAQIGSAVVPSPLMFVPLGMIQGLIGERPTLRDGVIRKIARGAIDIQQVTGPILIVLRPSSSRRPSPGPARLCSPRA